METLTDIEIEFSNVIDLQQGSEFYDTPDWLCLTSDHEDRQPDNGRLPLKFE